MLFIEVRCSTAVKGVFCEVSELLGEVIGVLYVVVKLSFELRVGVVEVIRGVVLICCVDVIFFEVSELSGEVIGVL